VSRAPAEPISLHVPALWRPAITLLAERRHGAARDVSLGPFCWWGGRRYEVAGAQPATCPMAVEPRID